VVKHGAVHLNTMQVQRRPALSYAIYLIYKSVSSIDRRRSKKFFLLN